MAYRMAQIPMILSEAERTGNIAYFKSMCLYTNWKARAACLILFNSYYHSLGISLWSLLR